MSTIKTSELDQFHEYNVYTPARLINFSGEVTQETASQFIKNIRLMDHVTDKDIIVLLNTDGGDVSQAMAMVDSIRECNSKVITHAVGPCYSAGAIIFQSGDVRRMSSNATLMIHLGAESYPEDHPLNIERWMAENKRIGVKSNSILFEKLKKKNPKLTKSQFDKLLIFDTIYTAEEAIKVGLADQIAEHKTYE